MKVQEVLLEIEGALNEVFVAVDKWFEKPPELGNYRPLDGGWTVNEVLEHISLTSYFLLKLIDKGTAKALKNVNNLNLAQELEHYSFEKDKLDEVGMYKSFTWIRPEHMEPTGEVDMAEVRTTIIEQKNQCLQYLASMPNGEGILYKTTMTVNNLGKINVYEYIYFLAKHVQRHITQMERNEVEFENRKW